MVNPRSDIVPRVMTLKRRFAIISEKELKLRPKIPSGAELNTNQLKLLLRISTTAALRAAIANAAIIAKLTSPV